MKKSETKLLASRAVNKIGNVISLFLNPIGGAVADRFKRRKILLVTDFIGGLMCALLGLIGNDQIMLYGLIAVNAALAMMSAFSGTSFRSYVVTVVAEDRLVAFNSRLEVISQIVSISSPLFAFLFVDRFGLKPTLMLDSVTFFLSFLLLFSIREEESHVTAEKKNTSVKNILQDIKEGMIFIVKEKEIFFLLVIASLVNFFIAAFNYLAPFSNQLFVHPSSYATLLTMGAAGSISGAVLANKLFKNSYHSILIALALCGVGLAAITVFAVLGLPAVIIVSGNLLFEFFLTIFNIHFFSLVQKKVPKHMLGRVFSSIFTVAVIFMPISTAIMTALPFSISIYAFAVIGAGILLVSGGGFLYSKKVLG